ncbi:hypothetical protein FDECE_10481 [Fusarium decemcellulare]|nr:hypothetical protein FDECE_10481 [Fusarium decemcellulare]
MRWPFRGYLPTVLLLSASASALTSLEQIEQNALPCPAACQDRGPGDWSLYPTADRLAVCPEPLLLGFGLNTEFNDGKANNPIYACTLGNATTKINFLTEQDFVDPDAMGNTNFDPVRRRAVGANTTCGAGPSEKLDTLIRLSAWESVAEPIGNDSGADVVVATKKLEEYLERTQSACGKTIMFAYFRGALVGLYSGSQVDRRKTLESLASTLNHAVKGGPNTRHAIEACDGRPASDVFGLVADPTGDFVAVQAAVKSWNEGKCVAGTKDGNPKDIHKVSAWGYTLAPKTEGSSPRSLSRRDTCRTIEVEHGDTCETLSKRCGISTDLFESLNQDRKALCNAMPVGQPVCCSSGPVPIMRAKVLADGFCTSYETKMGDICDTIAARHGISVDDLGKWNTKTWAWDGCGNLNPFVRICVSAGNPPMPASVWNAECGPTRNNTEPPGEGEELSELNPCPLNTDEFCLKSKSTTGNPGTGQPGEGGCISNCERTLTNNNEAPQKFRKIGYFEAWNYDRLCLHMHVLDIDKSYSHIHFSFAEISQNLNVVIPENVQEQFQAFIKATDFPAKKILAFGGWAFSNEGTGTGLFRKAVSPDNRQAFANRVVEFAVENNLDGVDFDWEYPGATDIEGSEPGQRDDGENYFQFLKLVREKLPKDKSLSIATPASFWYLKSFPIKKMAPLLDYVIFMTYDLHGQWDVGSTWASPGCPAGNCLRSHVNSTETMDALIMITRAGVESHKVVVGVSSYGRSFKMSSSTCRGPQCTYLGGRNDSKAKKGRCTDTAGYISDFEINEIIAKGGAIKKWYDEATDSDYLVYEGDEWVAYMSKVTKSRRMRDYMKLNFGGTTDWAIDLQDDHDKRYTSGRPVFLGPKVWETPSATCEAPCVLVFPPSKLPEATTIKLDKYTTSLEYGATGKTTISGKETTAFVTKTTTITVDVPIFVTNSMMYSNVNVTQDQKPTQLVVKPSIKLPHIPVQVPDGEGGTTTRTLTLPPWPFAAQNTGEPSNHSKSSSTPVASLTSSFNWDELETKRPEWIVTEETPDETISGLPVYTQWPEFKIEPIKEEIKEPTPDDDGFKTPCELWFFQLCFPGFKGLKWTIRPGILPPGPPPPGPEFLTRLPIPQITHPTTYPPWPPLTVGLDRKPTYAPKPQCETDSASLCWKTTTLSPTVIGSVTSTVTIPETDCKTIYGCSLTDWETELTKVKPCARPTAAPNRHFINDDTSKELEKRRDPVPHTGCYPDAIVVAFDLHQPGTSLSSMLDADGIVYRVIMTRSADGNKDLYVYWWIPNLDHATRTKILSKRYGNFEVINIPRPEPETLKLRRKSNEDLADSASPPFARRDDGEPEFWRRAKSWAASQVTLPEGKVWKDPSSVEYDRDQSSPYRISSRSELGTGQYVYVVGEEGINKEHGEFIGVDIEYLNVPIYHHVPDEGPLDFEHGSGVAAMAVGRTMGLSPKSTLVMASIPWSNSESVMTLSAWAAILKDIVDKKRLGNAVISCSQALGQNNHDRLASLLRKITSALPARAIYYTLSEAPSRCEDPLTFRSYHLDQLLMEIGKTQTVIVTSAGNMEDENDYNDLIDTYPALFGGGLNPVGLPPIADLMVRSFAVWNEKTQSQSDMSPQKVVWNGHSGVKSCLMGESPPPPGCPDLPADLSTLDDPPIGGPGGSSKRIKWEPGPDGPKCSGKSLARRLFRRAEATCGGQLCSGYYCQPNPPGPPPDFRDPKDPNRNGNDPQGGVKPPTTVTTTTSKPEPTGGSGSPGDNFGLRFMDKDCGEPVAADEYGKTERGCTSVASTSIYKVAGFTKNSYKACFYYNDNCEASSSSDYSMLSGGSGIPSSGGCVGFSTKAIKAYRVTSGECSGDIEDAWSLSFSKDCSGSLGEMSGYGKTECSNNIPKGANSVTGKIPKKGNWKACLYIYENCKTTEDPPGNEVFAHWNGDGCESFKSKKEFSSFILTNGTMCPFGE